MPLDSRVEETRSNLFDPPLASTARPGSSRAARLCMRAHRPCPAWAVPARTSPGCSRQAWRQRRRTAVSRRGHPCPVR